MDDPLLLAPYLETISLIRFDFRFKGKLRARGHVLVDQHAMERRVGFDQVEISEELAARQPEEKWLFRTDWQAHDRSLFRGANRANPPIPLARFTRVV